MIAIREGRRIYANSGKVALHLLSGNVSEVLALILGLAIRDATAQAVFPMSPIQILWLNMVTSSPVSLALGMELASPDIMQYPPRPLGTSLWTIEFIVDTFYYGILIGLLSLGGFILTIGISSDRNGLKIIPAGCNDALEHGCDAVFVGRAVAFYIHSLLLLIHGFNCRHKTRSIFKSDQKMNKYLVFAVVVGAALVLPTAYLGGISQRVFAQESFGYSFILIS